MDIRTNVSMDKWTAYVLEMDGVSELLTSTEISLTATTRKIEMSMNSEMDNANALEIIVNG